MYLEYSPFASVLLRMTSRLSSNLYKYRWEWSLTVLGDGAEYNRFCANVKRQRQGESGENGL